jgi:ectoine hydroxylase-related dioxygenase (phytanoyl-CoA dioxygenase family)
MSSLLAKASASARCLAERGFAVVPDIYSPDDIAEAAALMGGLYNRYQEFEKFKPARGWVVAGDMAPASTPGAGIAQPEILHPSLLEPQLLQSGLFRKCLAFIHSISPSVSMRFDHVIVKNPRSQVETPWHQDLAYTKTSPLLQAILRKRIHLWIPLQDATPENGCMEFVPGSHKGALLHHDVVARRSGHPTYVFTPDGHQQTEFGAVAAGGMTMHDIRTLHRAGANITDMPRSAWIIQFGLFGTGEQKLRRVLGKLPSFRASTST